MYYHHKHFSITLLISMVLHLFVLTVLFTVPAAGPQEEYKKVKVRLGKKNSQNTGNSSVAAKYSAYNPAAGEGTNSYIKNHRTVAEMIPEVPTPQIPEDKNIDIIQSKPAVAKPDQQVEQNRVQASQKIIDKPPGEKVIAANAVPAVSGTENTGIIIGNSSSIDAEAPASYEQMLPLWLDKFKKHPEEAGEIRQTGKGEIFIKIDRKGKVLLSKIIKSTGHDLLDKSLVQMITDADPVLPVPLNYHVDKKTFSYKIEFEFVE